jgi:hypothetical protein
MVSSHEVRKLREVFRWRRSDFGRFFLAFGICLRHPDTCMSINNQSRELQIVTASIFTIIVAWVSLRKQSITPHSPLSAESNLQHRPQSAINALEPPASFLQLISQPTILLSFLRLIRTLHRSVLASFQRSQILLQICHSTLLFWQHPSKVRNLAIKIRKLLFLLRKQRECRL